jgi:hypothetical protein
VRALGGRPTRRDDIERAYAAVAPRYDPATPLTHMYPAIRREITGRETPSKGLADKTLAKILGELRRKPR